MTDFDGDGREDLLARNSKAQLVLYKGNGVGNFAATTRPVVGTRWGDMVTLSSTLGFNGTGTKGIVAKRKDGKLYYYPILKNARWGASSQIGHGWSGFTSAGVQMR